MMDPDHPGPSNRGDEACWLVIEPLWARPTAGWRRRQKTGDAPLRIRPRLVMRAPSLQLINACGGLRFDHTHP